MHIFSPVLPGEGCSWWVAIFCCCTLAVTVPTLHVSRVNSRRNSLAGWSLYKGNYKMWWKRVQSIEPFGNCSQQLISVLKCLQGKTRWCFTDGMSSLIGRNLGLYILNIATGVYVPERLPCLTWMQITKITHNTGHETKYTVIIYKMVEIWAYC